jgi:arylsulfatase A-like enzyme
MLRTVLLIRLPTALSLLLALACSRAESRFPATEAFVPERVILVTIDTLRADHLNSYGYVREVSPFIDGLARRGVQFLNVITQMPTTAPSHASIFTSLYPFQHGLLTNYSRLDPKLLTMAEAFAGHGFRTAGFASITFLKSLSKGFEPLDYLPPHETLPNSTKKKPNRKADETVGLAVDWIADRTPSDRFFLWIHLFDVHQWIFPRDSEPERVKAVGFETLEAEQEWRRFLHVSHGIPGILERKQRAEAIVRYDSQLRFVDRELERFFGAMEARDLNRDSLWIVTSDHGEGLWNHDEVYHTPHLYDEQLRVPLILYAPDGELPNRQVETLVELVDLFPTLVELLGMDVGAHRDAFAGRSLLPLIRGEEPSLPERYAFSQRHPKDELNKTLTEGEVYSLRDLRFKYIHRTQGRSEFYDLEQDPLELENRIDGDSRERLRLEQILEARFRPLVRPAELPAAAELEERTLEELKALGYVRP